MSKQASESEIVKEADKLRLSGEYEKSIELLEHLIQENAFFAPAKLSLGRAYFESGKLENAAKILEEYSEFVPEHVLANKILARIYVHQEKFDQARVKVQLVLSESPDDPVAKKLQEDLAFDAAEELDQDDTVKTTMPTLTPTMAELYYHQGHFEEARKIYEKLLVHDPQNTDLQEKLRMITSEQSSPKEEVDKDPSEEAVMELSDSHEDGYEQQTMIETKQDPVEMLEMLLQRVQKRKRNHV